MNRVTSAGGSLARSLSSQSKALYDGALPKIGLEVHAQLNVASKLFSQGGNQWQATPNSQLDLFDVALPGTLPKLNQKAVERAILTALGLNCTIQDVIHFDRKNYFYADMPAGFQITQYNNPIAKAGFIDFIVTTYHRSVIAHSQHYDIVKHLFARDRHLIDDLRPYMKRSQIKQVQLELDSAKTLEQVTSEASELYSLIDYNRSGSALVEIVFEPDLTNHHEASSLIRDLIHLLKLLNTCDCELAQGSLRVDANVSIQSFQDEPIDAARVELKNLNSLRFVNRGIDFEIKRQTDLIKRGKKILQETRTYDPRKGETVPLRLKEDSVDYRYVPEPNIPPLRMDETFLMRLRGQVPSKTPSEIRKSLINDHKLELSLVAELMREPGLTEYFEAMMSGKPQYTSEDVADFLIYVITNLKEVPVKSCEIELIDGSKFMELMGPQKMQCLFDMILSEKLNFNGAYQIIKHIVVSGSHSDIEKLVDELNMWMSNDEEEIKKLCDLVASGMKNVSKKYKSKGDKKALARMLGKLCESYNDKVNIRRAIDCFDELLKPGTRVD